jgi:lipopolysaccharide/colanic/teichoic acid biosynthesis glycosyltransferase
MRFTLSLLVDLVLILLATVSALILRDNFEISSARLFGLLSYLTFTAIASSFIIPLSGINRTIWRFSAMPDYIRAVVAVTAIVVCAVLTTFAFNRLDGVPRSLPLLQFNLAISFLIGSRVIHRLHHAARRSRRRPMAPLKVVDEPAGQMILLVGLSPLTETYLQSATELARGRLKIAGILGRHDRHVGRLVAAHRVLGLPEHIERVLAELEVIGINIDRIVITVPSASLSRAAREAIEMIERKGAIDVKYLAKDLGFEITARQLSRGESFVSSAPVKFEIKMDEIVAMQMRAYWKVKRAIDVVASLCLLIATGPLQILIAVAVGGSMGWPIVFGQQRPGLGGRPFRVYKFRTMGAAHAADGSKLSDEERVSKVGNFLRRTRLDELPQLFSIFRGDMSFIGPRPLLAREQDEAHRARLLVRPGLTGWAQVIGGRTISSEDKAALDIWYVRNANLLLDIGIVLRTVPIVLIGERVSDTLIHRAWQDLATAGVLKVKGGLAAVDRLRAPTTVYVRNA